MEVERAQTRRPVGGGVLSFLDADIGEAPDVEDSRKRALIIDRWVDIVKGMGEHSDVYKNAVDHKELRASVKDVWRRKRRRPSERGRVP